MCGEFSSAPVFQVGFGISKQSCRHDDPFTHRGSQLRHVAGAFFYGGLGEFGHFDFEQRGNFHAVEIGIRIEHDFRDRSAVEAEQVGDAVFDVAGGFCESDSLEEPQRAIESVGTESDLFARLNSPAGKDGGFGFDFRIATFIADSEFFTVSFHPNGDEFFVGNAFGSEFDKSGFVTDSVDFDDFGFHFGKRERALFHDADVTDIAADGTHASKFFTFTSQVCNKWFSKNL